MLGEEVEKSLKGFRFHGVEFTEDTGTGQARGECPWCGKAKFYANYKTKLFDCKTCGEHGNFEQFLAIHARYCADMLWKSTSAEAEAARKVLALNRGLPRSAFQAWGVGWDGDSYTIECRIPNGMTTDLRKWRPGGNLISTPGTKVGLFGAEWLALAGRRKETVYVCEGEWDAMALSWLLKKLGMKGIVVGVPGANTFKPEWVPLFKDRDVVALYDADGAGEQGEKKCYQMIKSATRSLKFVIWPTEVPDGFDTRDWIKYGACKMKSPEKSWAKLQLLFTGTRPRVEAKVAQIEDATGTGQEEVPSLDPIGREELVRVYRKWLHIRDDDPIAIVMGTCLANRIPGDPLWMFLVAPPGGMKSELLMSLAKSERTYACSSLTPHTLVSGANFTGGGDPSLIPLLNGKVLIIKDFTTILTSHPMARDEIFGQMRDAYDGRFEKQFGNGVYRKYESTFGVLAGVTPSIDAYSSLHSGLGERFLKYRMDADIGTEDEEARILRAIGNVNQEVHMRAALQEAAARFLVKEVDTNALPTVSDETRRRIAALAMLVARMRGVVNRDRYNSQMLVAKASHEIGTRLAKQFSKLALGISIYYGDSEVGERAYRLVVKVATDSVPDKIEETVRTLYQIGTVATDTQTGQPKTLDVATKAKGLTLSTVYRTLQDLDMIGMLKGTKQEKHTEWALRPNVLAMIQSSGAYGGGVAASRKAVVKRKVVVRR